MNFLHSGGCGDVIYSMAVMEAMGGGVLYLKRKNKYNFVVDQYENLKELLEYQDYVTEVREYPETPFFQYHGEIQIDVDLDKFRLIPWNRMSQRNMVEQMFEVHGIKKPVPEKWISVWPKFNDDLDFAVFNRTERHLDPSFDWKVAIEDCKNRRFRDWASFIGLEEEFNYFYKNIHYIPHSMTDSLLDVAQYVSACSRVYCNQSVVLTLAQAMNKPYSLVVRPGTKNCIFNRKNEIILNA